MKELNTKRLAKLLAASLLSVGFSVRAAAPDPGIGSLLWPLVIIASPFIVVHDLIYGSDSDARTNAESEANKILGAYKDRISVNGLYAGSINLRWAIYGMLVESRLPFIEINTSSSAWLLSLAKDPKPLIKDAEQHKYIRLSLGKQGAPNCFNWTENWETQPPVRPGTCLLITFDDELQSDVQLSVDVSNVKNRILRWELIDRATSKVHLSVPFWESQTEGQPLRITATYRAAHEDYVFIRTLRRLSPVTQPSTSTERAFIMQRFAKRTPEKIDGVVTVIHSEFRDPTLPKLPDTDLHKNETWKEGYERAIATGKPVIINNTLLIVPNDDKVGPACAEPDNLKCTFAKNFISDIGVLTTNYVPAYQQPEAMRTRFFDPPPKHDMYITVVARAFNGNLLWLTRIQPTSFPATFQRCNDFSQGCYFYPTQANTTTDELVIRGKLQDGGRFDAKSDELELAVPLGKLIPFQSH